jgi:hypothetical protein
MLEIDPNKRIDAESVLNSKWMQLSFEDEEIEVPVL